MAGEWRNRATVVACILGAAALTIGIGVASAAKLKTKSESTTLSPDEEDAVTAKCKRGTKAVSGGFDAELALADSPFVIPYGSHRDGARGWSSSGFNAGDDPASITSFAYCRDAKVKARSSEVSVEGEETESATVRCPRGTKAFSGGFDNPDFFVNGGATAIFVFESRKVGKREWTVSGTNLGNVGGTLTAHVYCREGKGLKTVEEDVFNDHPDTWELAPRCGRGKRVVSGGFDYTLPTDEGGPFVYSSHKVGKREWEVASTNVTGAATFTAYAYCEKA
jgi:hypothetical protein